MSLGGVGMEAIPGKVGRIFRVKMTDFVTYDSVECFPGKGLNVVIGPNGSGKSTLLSAIVLGLGGKPSVMGRSPLIQDYIKTGCKEAKVEIELEGEKKNVKIKRTIYKDGKSSWLLNDVNASFKEIEKLMKSLNIQIDNLCQVLPQDRVQDFAKMNSQQLLESTQKAVGKEGLSNIHLRLKELRRQQQSVESSLKQDKTRREQEKMHADRLQGAVEKFQKKQGILQEVEMCTSKLEILKYKRKRAESVRFKEQKANAEKNVREIEKKLEPYKKNIKEAEKKCTEVQNKYTGMDQKVQIALKSLEKKERELEAKRHEIIEAEAAKENKLKDAVKQKDEVEKLRVKISRMRSDLASVKEMSKPEQEEKSAAFQKEIEELTRTISSLRQQKLAIESNMGPEMQQLQNLQSRQLLLQNVRQNRLRSLKSAHKDAYTAAMWIEENRHRFEMNVFLPMCVELNVTDPEKARYVESAVGYHDLVALVCESKADFKLIVNELRAKQRLGINVLHAEPLPDNFHPLVDLNTLNRVCPGFSGYLKDFVTGPQTLISLLCKQKHFHRIPVGNESVNPEKVPREIYTYFSGDYKKSVRKSRYTGDDVRTNDPVERGNLLNSTIDPQELEQLNERTSRLQASLGTVTRRRDQLNNQIAELESSRNGKRSELGKIQTLQSTLETRNFQLAQKERDLKRMENSVTDPEKVKEKFIVTVKALVEQLTDLQEPQYASLKCVEKCVRDGQVLEFAVLAAKDNAKSQRQKCKKEQDALNEAKNTLEELNNICADLKTEGKRMLIVFERRTGIPMERFNIEKEEVLNTLPQSIEDLEADIEEKKARAEILGGGIDGAVLQEYENRVRQLSELDALILRKEAQSERLATEMSTRREEWGNELNTLVSNINNKFSSYFRSMGCAGAVELFTGNSEHDYDNYGLKVRVKFRDSEELQTLNAHTQSGGERAVTTAIFMLSLQELTPVPFRLVDEINQGMDSINERRVYELLLTSVSQPETPQYFLLTPKILKDMPYSQNTTVLCIINSPCAPDHRFWDIGKFIQLRSGGNDGGQGMDTDDD